MRSAVVLGGLSSVALILHGCGGGGGGDDGGKACVNTQLQLVSQSWDAKTNLDITVATKPPNPKIPTTKQSLAMDLTEKWDVDNVNMYSSVTTDMKIPVEPGKEQTAHVVAKLIFNAEKQEAVMKTDVTGDVTMSNCTKAVLPWLPKKDQLATYLKMIPVFLQSKMKCGSNDGTYDSWEMDLTLPDPSIPIPAKYMTGSMKETMKLGSNYILHMATLHSDLTINAPIGKDNATTITEMQDMTMTTSNANTGGPTASDLDYSSWGDCKEVKPKPPGPGGDLFGELADAISPDETFMPRVMSQSFFYRSILQAAQKGLEGPVSDEVTV